MFKLVHENRKRIITFIKTLVFYFIVYGIMLNTHFSSDSYRYFSNPKSNNEGNIALGRFGDYIVNKIVCNLNFNYVRDQVFFVAILIVMIAVSTELLYSRYIALYDGELSTIRTLLLRSAVVLMFCNVFIWEWFVFVEMSFLWALSLLFMDLAVLQINPRMGIKKCIKATIFMAISVGFYQATIGYFLIFSLVGLFIGYRGKLNKSSFGDSVKVFICGGASGISNLLFIKIVQILGIANVTARTEEIHIEQYINNIHQIISGCRKILMDTYGFLPRYFVLSLLVVIHAILVLCMIQKGIKEISMGKVVYILLLIVTCNAAVYIPHLLTSDIWMAPRTIVCFFVMISLPCILVVVESERDIFSLFCLISICVCLLVNIIKIQQISINLIASNKIDEELAYMINDEIKQHEETTGTKIKKIAIFHDMYPRWGYASVKYTYMDTNLRSFIVGWGGVDCINYYTNSSYMGAEIDEEIYNKYFKDKNWDSLDLEEQMVYKDDTLFLAAY